MGGKSEMKEAIAKNKVKAGATGGIEAIVKSINTHIKNSDVCECGCWALKSISVANTYFQKDACGKGGLAVLLRVLSEHSGNMDVSEACCGTIGTILSSPETHYRYCSPEVIKAVEECYGKYKDSEKIKQSLLSLKREEDSRVHDAVERGVCTKGTFLKCNEECECDNGYYCPKCCVQQRAFRCLTCDKDKIRLYCEVCWKRDHKGHKGDEFFCPARCATSHK